MVFLYFYAITYSLHERLAQRTSWVLMYTYGTVLWPVDFFSSSWICGRAARHFLSQLLFMIFEEEFHLFTKENPQGDRGL